MKKIDNERKSIFIQRSDLDFMLSLNSRDLLDISEKIKVDFQGKVKDMNDYTEHEFLEYTDPEVVEFLGKQDWVLDYDTINLTLSEFSIFRASIDRKVADLLELEEKYNTEYQAGKTDVEKQLINKKIADLYKQLIPLLHTQDILYSEHFASILAGKIELNIPNGISL
ncbi:MAG: hypothetical protein IJ501_05115 [Bacilli bacterium]|nr:hypothetical protein [Bacilli bacterium]